jgi:hypothetical protein
MRVSVAVVRAVCVCLLEQPMCVVVCPCNKQEKLECTKQTEIVRAKHNQVVMYIATGPNPLMRRLSETLTHPGEIQSTRGV